MQSNAATSEEGLLPRLIDAGLILILLAAPTQYSFEVANKVYLSVVDPLVWIVAALWGVHVLRSGALKQVRLPPVYMLLFIATGVVSMISSVQRMTSLKDLFQFVEYFIAAYLVFTHRMAAPGRPCRFVGVFLAVAAMLVLCGVVQYATGSIEDFRVRGSFGNRNVFGGFLALALPIFFGVAMHAPRMWVRAACLVVVAAGLAVTLSGGAFLAIALALVVLAVLRHLMVFIGVSVVLCAGLVFLLPEMPRANYDVLYESIALYPDGYDVGSRYTEWQAAAVMTEENPLLGVGIGNYQANIGQYYGSLPSPPEKQESDSQNMYLVIASTMGLAGFALFVGLLASHGWKALLVYARATAGFERGLSLGLFGAVLAFSVACIWSPLLVRGIGVPLSFIFALIAVMHTRQEQAT